MERVLYFFNAGLCFWALALFVWCFYATPWAAFPGVLAFIAFLLHGQQQRVIYMFGKNKKPAKESQDTAITPSVSAFSEKELPTEEKQNNTVISSEVRFEGNIIAAGQVYIYGQVYGDIESAGGIIKIMRNGMVEGNIVCRELIIDGTVQGVCRAESIDIHENGKINGAISYTVLAVRKGGMFTGQSAAMQAGEKKITNVIDIAAEKTLPNITGADNVIDKKAGVKNGK